MSDIVLRLRHCKYNCGDEYLRELSGRAADEIERMKAEVSALNHAEVKLLVQVDEQDDEIERLRAALLEAIEFASLDEQCLTPAGEAMVDRWRAALKEDSDE